MSRQLNQIKQEPQKPMDCDSKTDLTVNGIVWKFSEIVSLKIETNEETKKNVLN